MKLILTGDSPIIYETKAKRANLKRRSRIVLFVGGGALSAVYSAGVLMAFEEMGLTQTFDVAVGQSAGAINLSCFLAGQSSLLPDIYKDIVSSRFLNLFRFHKIFDFDCVENAVRSRLSIEKMIANRTEFYAGATSISDGRGEFIKVKNNNLAKLWDIIKASAIPPLTFNSAVRLGSDRYVDGEIGFPFPAKEISEKFMPTHLLMVLNRPYHQHSPLMPFLDKILIMSSLYIHAPSLWLSLFEWEGKSRTALRHAEHALSRHINIGVISPSQEVSETCRDQKLLDDVTRSAFLHTLKLFK